MSFLYLISECHSPSISWATLLPEAWSLSLHGHHLWGAIKRLKSKSESHTVVSDSAIPWIVACQLPLSVEFSRQEYWSGLSFPSPGDFPVQGSNPGLLHCRQVFTIWATREACEVVESHLKGWEVELRACPHKTDVRMLRDDCLTPQSTILLAWQLPD